MSNSFFIKKHSVLTFFTITFAISWGGILIVIGSGGFLGTTQISEVLMPFLYMTTLLGPSVAGILLTGLVHGREGFRTLLSRLLIWRVGAYWYVLALFTAPFLLMVTLFVLMLTSSAFIPGIFTSNEKESLLISGIVAGIMVGIFEEIGWTGFVVPQMRQQYSIIKTGLIVGFMWGLWHLPLFMESARASDELPPFLYLSVLLFSFLPVFRVLMVWVYDRTKSLLVAMLMHTSLTASILIIPPQVIVPVKIVIYNLVFAATLWLIVSAVVIANRGKFSR